MLFAISAPSGTGKTTIVKEIIDKNPDIAFSVSATTRKRRGTEKDGKDYLYFTKEEFEEKIKKGELVEYEVIFNGDFYGTLKKPVEDTLAKGSSMIFDIDVNGALNIKKIYGKKAVLIFIAPPGTESLRQRLRKRATESKEQINERIKRVDLEMGKANEFDYIVVNDKLENAISEVQKIINKYRTK